MSADQGFDPHKSTAIRGLFLAGYTEQTMRRALLLYNPESGQRRARRLADVESAAAVLREQGVEATPEATREPGSAAAQAREAVDRGCDAIIVCGGDGSINETLPGIVGTQAALGVIPGGTLNGLANDIGIPANPGKAARVLATAEVRPIAMPCIQYRAPNGPTESRYWIMGAGIGADAYMAYRITIAAKRQWGMAAYLWETTRQWLTHEFPLFFAEFKDEAGVLRREQVSQVLAIRIANFGGPLRRLAPGADLARRDFHLVLFKSRRRAVFLRYMLGVWAGRPSTLPDVVVVPSAECHCFLSENGDARIYAEVDGEVLGRIPVTLTMTEQTVNLLVPRARARKTAVL
ncbi:MAG: diacylglycerol/lipid kinase family protein [Terriglobales bacterium]